MTRLSDVILSQSRAKFRNYKPVPLYKQILPASLKNSVSTKGEGRKVAPCLQEMSVMLTCLQKHDFSEYKCSKEVQHFVSCQADFKQQKLNREEIMSKGVLQSTSAGGKLPPSKLNELLSRYPQPRKERPVESVYRTKTRKG